MAKYAAAVTVMIILCVHAVAVPTVRASEGNDLKTIEQLVKEAQEDVSYIGIEEMKDRIKKNDKLVLLDVRTKREYDAAHIKGSAWIERGISEFVLVRTLPNPDAEIVVYCKQGNRVGLVIKALKKAGYKNVTGLDGGFDEWVRRGATVRNFLGDFKMVSPAKINAASFGADLYENKR